ncbi:YozQ family protein [Oceanobacillus halotolerans]|uniref:YozQ family protein n=1 Tax=Oceanobacillus halotolerans TaxID=2663380 RepID=UPI001CF79596|nr:YozQ family protein [Oceanobacillus halotolerans]
MDKKNRETLDNAEKVAGKMYDPSDYNRNDQASKGMAITHEQVSDDYTEGTIDGKIDEINEQGEVTDHEGEAIKRNRNE